MAWGIVRTDFSPRRIAACRVFNGAVRPFAEIPRTPDPVRDTAGSGAGTRELELLTQAIQALPEACRQVLTLRKIYGLSQREIAARLGLTETAVEAQVAEGLRRCAKVFGRNGIP